jgi:hypothetical protein
MLQFPAPIPAVKVDLTQSCYMARCSGSRFRDFRGGGGVSTIKWAHGLGPKASYAESAAFLFRAFG